MPDGSVRVLNPRVDDAAGGGRATCTVAAAMGRLPVRARLRHPLPEIAAAEGPAISGEWAQDRPAAGIAPMFGLSPLGGPVAVPLGSRADDVRSTRLASGAPL